MLRAAIFCALVFAPWPGQLAPEAMEAARQQRIHDYYARWVGVRAPEFGSNVRDRVNGPPVRLAEFQGKKVLLYSFDAGNFVHSADRDIFPENLRTLHRVREKIGRDKFAVVGDGLSEMLVGFNAYTGLHLVSNSGKTLWTKTEVGNCWTVAGFDAGGGRPGLALTTGADGAIRIYDANGHQLRRIVPTDTGVVTFAAAEMSEDGDRQVLIVDESLVGAVDHIVACDLEGNVLWRYPIVSFDMARCPAPMIAGDVTGDGTKEWVFQVSDRQVVAVGAKGQLMAEFPNPSKGPVLLTAVRPGPGQPDLIILSDGKRLVAYRAEQHRGES